MKSREVIISTSKQYSDKRGEPVSSEVTRILGPNYNVNLASLHSKSVYFQTLISTGEGL
ncbi:hypothetical protein J6590_007413 [Homalodisca vitripennis]|nr:hypothetical protein J6590_007413 [Homalodisca vitripennis]